MPQILEILVCTCTNIAGVPQRFLEETVHRQINTETKISNLIIFASIDFRIWFSKSTIPIKKL